MSFFKGYKTYIIGTLTVLFGVAGYFTGNLDSHTAVGFVFGGLGVMGLRNGITTEMQNLAGMLPDKTLPPTPPQS